MTIGTSRVIAGGVLMLCVVGAFFAYYSKRDDTYLVITDFAACQAAGYRVTGNKPQQCQTPDGRFFVSEVASGTPVSTSSTTISTSDRTKEDRIRVSNISPNQLVTSPLTIEGFARGYWYFEASFPVELIDGDGKRLALEPAHAKSNWMTDAFVPFSVTLSFSKPKTATGTLILHRDNPSGLPENDDELRIPVRFATEERAVKLYYYNSTKDKDAQGNTMCSDKGLVVVNRTISVTQTPLADTVRLLLRGELTSGEKSKGITTEFPLPGVSLASASLSKSGALTLVINDPSHATSGGACRSAVLRAQVEETVRQFSEVKTITFLPATVFQP